MGQGIHGKNFRLLGGGFDLSPYVRKATAKGDITPVDDTNVTDVAHRYKGGLMKGGITATGLYSDAATEVEQRMEAMFADANAECLLLCPDGYLVVGQDFAGVQGFHVNHEVNSPLDDMVDVAIECQSNVGLDIGRILTPNTAIVGAAPVNGTAVDLGAAGTNGGAAYLECLALTGTSFVARIEDSADGSTGWAAIATFASQAAIGEQRIEIGGAVRRYVRGVVFSGTYSSVTPVIGFAPFPA